ncbi:MAG: substrate-binding domain-containing protein [Paracoccaceae bacterium]
MKKFFNKLILILIFIFSSKIYGDSVLLQSTTSTKNSGFYSYILPIFKNQTGITVKVVAVGTGQAIRNAENCDADVLIVHAKKDEEAFVANGNGVKRHNLMYNDFVILGPSEDPAKILSSISAESAFNSIFKFEHSFISRGDNSGTHKKEKQLWENAKINISDYSGKWYKETGSGMGTTLNIAAELDAYTLSDRATWITFKNKKNLKILYQGDRNLFNQYGAILINPEKCPFTNVKESKVFLNWLLSKIGQETIRKYKVNKIQLFYPNAN